MKPLLESNYLIPLGSELRVLLNSEHISYGEVHSALKLKGIFSGGNDKSVTVPLLTATLLKPSEYSALIDASVGRDSKPKVKVSSVELVAPTSDWVTPLKELFTDDFNPFASIENIEVIEAPWVVIESKNKIRIPFSIVRKDFSKDWTQRELRFEGEVTIERDGGRLKLDFSSTHTSKETEIANRRISARISKALKASGVTNSEVERRITFNSFTNVERVRFFNRLTGGHGRIIGKGSVNDMEINRDISGPPLPNDPQVSWMNHTVKRLKIDGDKLNDIFLISDEKYYPYYHVQRMDVTFSYTSAANSGDFRAGFFFSGPSRGETVKDEAELTFEILRISHQHSVNSDAKKVLSTQITHNVRLLIEAEYERILNERASTP